MDQYGLPCALCGGYNHSPKDCFKGEHDINDIMEKMNINGHQSQSSGLYVMHQRDHLFSCQLCGAYTPRFPPSGEGMR